MTVKTVAMAAAVLIAVSITQPVRSQSRQTPVVQGPRGHVEPGEALIVGEVHGTNEVPKAFLALVDESLSHSKLVSVGLELPVTAGLVDCADTGNSDAFGDFWKRRSQDGRSSRAMLELVCALKKLAAQGRVRLLYLGNAGKAFPEEAARRIDVELTGGHPVLVLIGNFHNRNLPESVTGLLRARGRKVTALTASAKAGTAWNCTAQGCLSQPVSMAFCDAAVNDGYLISSEIVDKRWDGCLVVPAVTSSAPAIESLRPHQSARQEG